MGQIWGKIQKMMLPLNLFVLCFYVLAVNYCILGIRRYDGPDISHSALETEVCAPLCQTKQVPCCLIPQMIYLDKLKDKLIFIRITYLDKYQQCLGRILSSPQATKRSTVKVFIHFHSSTLTFFDKYVPTLNLEGPRKLSGFLI